MPDHLGDDMRKVKTDNAEEPEIKGKMESAYFPAPQVLGFSVQAQKLCKVPESLLK